jgi:serine/threonine-protein kinase RsbW
MKQMSDSSKVEKEIKVSIPMLPDMELAVSSLASALAQTIELSEEEVDAIKLAVIEACLNSFEHSKSKDQMVHVHFLIKPDALEVVVRDNGKGFDPETVATPKIGDKFGNAGKGKRGWGLHIMKSLMDSVEIKSSPNGTQIIMTKRRN